jgi:putative transposase
MQSQAEACATNSEVAQASACVVKRLRNFPASMHWNRVEYRRNLPHFQPEDAELFITFRLYGTLPLASGRDGRAFAKADRELEHTPFGPSWLSQPRVADCVTDTIRDGERVRALYGLIAFVVMPNHVHLLIEPQAPGPKITQFVKGVSAKRANELLGRTGHRFWQDESFDRWVRSDRERANIIRYIESIRCGRIWRWSHNCFGTQVLSQAEACATGLAWWGWARVGRSLRI